MGTIYRNGKVNTIIKNGKIYGYASGGGSEVGQIYFYKRIIEQGWNNNPEITYTFDEDIDDCILALTYTRETTLTDTRYTLTLSSGSYEELEDSGIVVGSTTQERIIYLKANNIKIGDTLYMYNWGDLKTADILKYTSGGGSVNIYTNGKYYEQDEQITDVSEFTKIYDSSIPFGNYGEKIQTNLSITSEATLNTNMNSGWESGGSSTYNTENQIGAYGGYIFGEAIDITQAKFWIGRYVNQNKTLIVTFEYLDENNIWQEIKDVEITTNLEYPLNVFPVKIYKNIYGIRWKHKKGENKTSGNTITFFGMTLYKGIGTSTMIYIPYENGCIKPPVGYNGFGSLYIP